MRCGSLSLSATTRREAAVVGDAHVDVSRLGQDALALHNERQVPRRSTLGTLALVNHDRVQQPFPAHFRDPAPFRADRLQRAEAGAHLFAEAGGARRQVFVHDDFERGLGDGTRERVLCESAEGSSVQSFSESGQRCLKSWAKNGLDLRHRRSNRARPA